MIENPKSGVTYTTNYTYDVLDDLTGVTQQGQTRVFAYDSLKRLSASTNPENYTGGGGPGQACAGGTYALCYFYDNDGNVTKKTDNRGFSTSFVYDGLNRISSKLYTDGTPTVSYAYDSAGNNSVGHLTSVSNSSSATSYGAYDPKGRPGSSAQTTSVSGSGANTYSFAYGYFQSGSLQSETYPSQRQVFTNYDLANRVTSVGAQNCNSGSLAFCYATEAQYTAHGAATRYVFGNNLWHLPTYNSRLQMSGFSDLVNNTTFDTHLKATLN